jgi:D-beta-D-heptose 7-phosphate kinase/D-beta-D-heptose 1-phosphate adenosyltransferase
VPEAERAALVEALGCVDAVALFDEDTPLRLIQELVPDVLVKGADYTLDRVVGRDVVEAAGGRVALAPLLPGHSTSRLIELLTRG